MPNFTVPVDHFTCKTGISPFERCATIHAIVDEESRPEHFVRPGHLFPLVARDGGVLVRQGHTEASVDLVRMAGLRPAAVLCEICSVPTACTWPRVTSYWRWQPTTGCRSSRSMRSIEYRLKHDVATGLGISATSVR